MDPAQNQNQPSNSQPVTPAEPPAAPSPITFPPAEVPAETTNQSSQPITQNTSTPLSVNPPASAQGGGEASETKQPATTPQTSPPSQIYISSVKNIVPPPPPQVEKESLPTPTVSSSNQHKKFPFMIVTAVLIVVTVGFSFSFFFLGNPKTPDQKLNLVKITPPVTSPAQVKTSPTAMVNVNPFASPSASYQNPFAAPTESFENPFGATVYENPFSGATQSADTANQPYQNPFEGTQQ